MTKIARTIAIGDLQGCSLSFFKLLRTAKADLANDKVWLVGDLVNRGPGSLEILRWVKANQASVVTVLGNHDMHLLACASGVRPMKPTDTLEDVLSAHDKAELIEWLRQQPLLILDAKHCLVHAGIHPKWDIKLASELAEHASERLRGPKWQVFLRELFDYRGPLNWDDADNKNSELALVKAVKIMTTLRCVNADGSLDTNYNGPLDACPVGTLPWFHAPRAKPLGRKVIFGHWAALGWYQDAQVTCLDTGCVWGRKLTGLDLQSGASWSEPCADAISYVHRP